MTGCAEHGPEVSAYLDDGLNADERRRVELHLGGCARCRELLRASRELDSALRELPRVEPSPGFEALLRERIAGDRKAAPGWRGRRGLTRWAAASAAAALLALLISPGSSTLSDEDWELIADEESFDLMLSDDHDLVYALDVLEEWDEKEEI